MKPVPIDDSFVVLEERKSTTGSRWNGDTVVEHHRLREVFDERFSTAAEAQLRAVDLLRSTNRKARTLVIAELRLNVISQVDVSTKVEPFT
jgi:hypothetical protein